MATDFSTKATDVDTQIEPSARLVEPVSREGELSALDTIGKGVAVGFKTAATYVRNKGEADKNKTLAKLSTDLISIDDAMEQGLSITEGSTRKRALLSQYLGAFPQLEEDILTRYSTNRSQSGFSDVDTQAAAAAKIRQSQQKAAIEGGWLSQDDIGNSEKEDAAFGNMENFQRQVRDMEVKSKEISLKASRIDLSSKEREILKKEAEETTIGGLSKIGQAALPYWESQYNNLKAAIAKAPTEQDRQRLIKEGVLQLERDYANRSAAISGSSLSVDQAKIDQILKPQKNLIDSYIKELSGEYDTEQLKRSTDNAKAQAEWQTLNGISPRDRQLLALSNLLGENAGAIYNDVANIPTRIKMIGDNSAVANEDGTFPNKPADVIEYTDDNRGYLSAVTKMIAGSNKGTISQEAKGELDTQISGILRGVDVYSTSANSAKEFQPVIDFFANPEVGKYMQGSGAPADLKAAAVRVIRDGYASYVVPEIRKELASGSSWQNIRIGDTRYKYDEVVEPSMDGGRFGFKLKPEFSNNMNAGILQRQLNNSSLTKVMNKMIISNSHINGNTDYQKSYEELAPLVFDQVNTPNMGIDKQTTGSVKQDFSLNELASVDPASLSEVTPELKKAASGGITGNPDNWINETDPIKIAKSFEGVDEAKDAHVIASFIKKSAGININPAKTAWCAAFINGVLGATGATGTNSLAARSFLSWGSEVKTPSEGDVAVFSRGSNPNHGHVGFYMGEEDKDGVKYIRVLSGNQGNSVNESLYPASRLLGYRRIKE